jgi:hypothetical protein
MQSEATDSFFGSCGGICGTNLSKTFLIRESLDNMAWHEP